MLQLPYDGEIMTSFGEKITGGAGMKNNIFILDQINFPELASLFASKRNKLLEHILTI